MASFLSIVLRPSASEGDYSSLRFYFRHGIPFVRSLRKSIMEASLKVRQEYISIRKRNLITFFFGLHIYLHAYLFPFMYYICI
ncbi:hypothetical protein QL285_090774 [Trifolium repens]|nr:hypothetical protein QL285_090774 [Trifolium repens]